MKETSDSDNTIRKSVLKSESDSIPNRNTSVTSTNNLKFASQIKLREYDKHDTASSVGSIIDRPSGYEPVNFTLASSGKIVQYCHPDDDLELTKHRDDINRRNSSRADLEDADDRQKVTVFNLWLSDHIQGEVVSKQVFSVQECMIWFSVDNWTTFQETTAFEEHNSSNTEIGPRYKFDFIIPKMNDSLLIDDDEQRIYDIYGQPLTIQFHVIIRSGKLIYLDNDFKVYSLKLKSTENTPLPSTRAPISQQDYEPEFMEIQLDHGTSSQRSTLNSLGSTETDTLSMETQSGQPKQQSMVSQLKQGIKKFINPNKETP